MSLVQKQKYMRFRGKLEGYEILSHVMTLLMLLITIMLKMTMTMTMMITLTLTLTMTMTMTILVMMMMMMIMMMMMMAAARNGPQGYVTADVAVSQSGDAATHTPRIQEIGGGAKPVSSKINPPSPLPVHWLLLAHTPVGPR